MLENAENVIHSNTIYTNQHELTTIKKDGTGLANNYDHFSYSENEKKIIKDFGVLIRDLNTESDYQDYLKKVSDHLPIFLEIDFK